jgi:ATP-dependent RNA helicase HelY
VLAETDNQWEAIDRLERSHRLAGSEPLAAQRAWAVWQWASGMNLNDVIEDDDVAVGDFVRLCKQVIDVLDHISQVDDGPVGSSAGVAKGQVFRGIVALSSLI